MGGRNGSACMDGPGERMDVCMDGWMALGWGGVYGLKYGWMHDWMNCTCVAYATFAMGLVHGSDRARLEVRRQDIARRLLTGVE